MISMILPLNIAQDGYLSYTDAETKEAIQQNLKMLILTRPGEYTMDINFGVGLHNYLFDPGIPSTTSRIQTRIYNQAAIYMPYIKIVKADVNFEQIDNNVLKLIIEYKTSASLVNEYFELITTI